MPSKFTQLYRSAITRIPTDTKTQLKNRLGPIALLPNIKYTYWDKRTPIIVYQMGRVGSGSVAQSLRALGEYVFHIHVIDTVDNIKQPSRGTEAKQQFRRKQAQWAYKHIIKSGRKVKIITLVRDPLAVNISWFFLRLDTHTGVKDAHKNLSLAEIQEMYIAYASRRPKRILNWFENQLNPALGINVYNHSFPTNKGYTSIQKGNQDVLIMRLEMDDAIKETCIAEFLGINGFKLQRKHVGEEQEYAEMYRAFKKSAIIPEDVLDMFYNSKLAQHFYTPTEVEQFREKWEHHE
jgi:hypothetical protein